MEQAFERTKKILASNGCRLIELDMKSIEENNVDLSVPFVSYEARFALRKYLHDNKIPLTLEDLVGKIMSPDATELFETFILESGPKAMSKEFYEKCLNEKRPRLIDDYKRLFEQVDLLAYPTMCCLPPRVDEATTGEIMNRMVRNTDPSSNAGIPSLSIPMGVSDIHRVHIGLNLDASFGRDRFLLRCGALIHKSLD